MAITPQNITIATSVSLLARTFNLSKLHVPDKRDNPYNVSQVQKGYQAPDESLRDSAIGTPVYADLTLWGGTYTDNITGQQVDFPAIQFDAVIITVDLAAKIIKTDIQGRDGTVKEYIGQDDARVSIQGIICGWNGHYPIDEVGKLNEWRKAPIAKLATSKFLQNLGISNLVVEECSIPQIAGGYSYQQFSMSCLSDLPVELRISQ
jgi:hypothetical protein